MLFIVDGYNVTRSDPSTRGLSLEDQREALVRRLRARGPQMLGAGRIVVVFDGAQGTGGIVGDTAPVRVVYAREDSADDAIVRTSSGVREKVVIVSNDRELVARVRVHAAGSVEARESAACYESAGRGASRRGRVPAPQRDAGLPAGANKITEELKDLWLTGEDR